MTILSRRISLPLHVWMATVGAWIFAGIVARKTQGALASSAEDEEMLQEHENVLMDDEDDDDEQLPNMLERDDIAFFFALGMDELFEVLHLLFEQSHRIPITEDDVDSMSPEQRDPLLNPMPGRLLDRGSGSTYTTRDKLLLDFEQARYLSTALEDETERQFFGTIAMPIYQEVLNNMPPEEDLNHDGLYHFRHQDYKEDQIDLIYNKAWRCTHLDPLVDESTDEPVSLLNPLSRSDEEIQEAWNNGEGVVVLDNFLTDTALEKIQQIMRESTVWFESSNIGYTSAAYLDDGLYDKLLLQLAYQVHDTLPSSVLPKEFALHDLWARKYDDREKTVSGEDAEEAYTTYIEVGDPYSHLHLHIWLSPDDETEHTKDGQLVIFTAKPPQDWATVLGPTGNEVMENIIEPSGFANVTVPFAKNRAVLFDSTLFYQQSKFEMVSGTAQKYENRRTDLTLLYGESVHHEEEGAFEEGEEL